MLLLGFEPQDVLRVTVGIALGLLTIFRRELSCNRGYHPDDDDPLGDSSHRLLQAGVSEERGETNSDSPSRLIRRRKSSSALPSMAASDEQHDNMDANNSATCTNNNEDPTEELLESAGLFLSGGPFLYMAIAVFDHLLLTSFISTFTSASFDRFRTKIGGPQQHTCEEDNILLQQSSESSHDRNEETQENQQHVYSVAWNAATEYYTSISAKLDGPSTPGSAVQRQNNDDGPSGMQYRSKSTGNLQQNLSDEHSRALFREMIAMANSGSMDITLLPSDAQIVIFSYLPPQDVLAFTCTNRAGRNLLDDGDVHGGEVASTEEESGGIYVKNGDTALLIWKALFQRDYSWVLTDWAIGKEAFLRSMTDYGPHQNDQQQQQRRQHHSPKAGKVFHHMVSILDSEHAKQLPVDNMMEASALIHPTSSMKEFYFTFTETWLNYTIAGCNSTEKCLIGLHGHVFDISNFVEEHPGSSETLLLQAGGDATVFFESMGHSMGARKLALRMCAVVNGQCARYNFAGGEGSNGSFQLRAGPLGPLFSTWGLIKPSCKSLDIKRNIPGFLIPSKRSSPRFQGGLHRIRERIQQEEKLQLTHAESWQRESLGPSGLFGGVRVYYDPFRGWKWWYTDRDFNAVFITPQR